MSLATSFDQVQSAQKLTDEQAARWHPATISDRKLLELQKRLVMVRRYGGAFADIALSPDAQRRLDALLNEA